MYPHDRAQLSQMLEGRTDMLKIIIISASVIGTMLLLLNIVIVSYVIYKKKTNGKGKQEEGIPFNQNYLQIKFNLNLLSLQSMK